MAAEPTTDTKTEASSLDDGDSTGDLILTSKDGKSFKVDRKNAFISTLVKTGLDTDASATEVPIPGVKSEILEEVIKYMNHHKGTEPPIIEKPLRSKLMKDVCTDKWDAEFIDKIGENRQQTYDLILGQPLEKIKDILSTGCKGAVEKKDDKKEDTK